MSEKEQIEKMKNIIEKLAPEDGIYIDEEFSNYPSYCIFCGEFSTVDHAPDCVWVEARKLLEELK